MKEKEKRKERKQQIKTKSKGNPGSPMTSDSKNQVITATKQVKQGQIYRAENLQAPFSFPSDSILPSPH